MGFCADDREFQSTKKDIDESKSKKRVWAKVLLDELTEYVSARPSCIRLIEDRNLSASTALASKILMPMRPRTNHQRLSGVKGVITCQVCALGARQGYGFV